MRARFAQAAGILALVVSAAAACASSGATSAAASADLQGPQFPVEITVDNNLQNLKSVTVYVAVGTGGRKMLGQVESNRKRTFTYQGTAATYRLYAKTAAAADAEIVSDPVQVAGAMTMTWHLSSNTLVPGN